MDCEGSWALKNWCFWTVVWRRLLRVPGTVRRSNQSILKEISPGLSLEGLMLKLKFQYCGHLMRRVDSLEKSSGCWWWTGRPSVLWFMGSQIVDTTERLTWTELNWWGVWRDCHMNDVPIFNMWEKNKPPRNYNNT